MSEETFEEWVREYHSYVKNLTPEDPKFDAATMTIDRKFEESSDDQDTGDDGGLDALFDRTLENDGNRISQYITKLDNGRLLTVKSPGEIGS